VKADKAGRLGEVGKTQRPLTEIEMELARTKKELVEVKIERDILRKAAAYFAKESLCPVGDDERTAAQVPCTGGEASFKRVSQRVLCLAGPAAVEVSPGGNAAGD
jgi:hypothetical protein